MSRITTNIDLVINTLKRGEIVAIPTETVYGLSANAENEEAIRKVYAVKNRPLTHPLIMHVAENWDLTAWVSFIPDYAYVLIEHFWPGPLTLVLPAKMKNVSPLITGGQETIALRCPSHPLAQTLLQKLDFPLVAPSANPFGKISPTTAEHVQQSFPEKELLIWDGGRCQVGIESTILSALNPQGFSILRQGIIDELQLKTVLPEQQLPDNNTLRVPGKLATHYQPEKPLYCFPDLAAIKTFCQQNTLPVYVLSFSPLKAMDNQFYYQLPANPTQVAFELYYQLRLADHSLASCIAIELPPDEEPWAGVRERILKAGQQI